MFISADKPNRSLRSVTINNEEMVLVVGESHKTGQGKDTMEHYKALEAFGEQTFGLETIPYRWSAQDLITLDKVPYIGEITPGQDRKSTRLNSSHVSISYAVFCLKKKPAYVKISFAGLDH